ncbi:MAG: protein kinase [Planctomycetota bacterium]
MKQLGPYTLVRELGRGGMGVVHEAQAPDGRRVALKLILDTELSSLEELLRFQREARVSRLLDHPNLVRVLDAGRAEGKPYLVLELVDGESLHDLVRREGPLPPAEAVRIARELASALGALHGKGLLHRDVKPSNVLVGAQGEVKLIDLGLVKDRAPASQRLTLTGQVLGTPGFLAPEQAQGERTVDERADVYGLGATLYYALTAAAPHSGRSAVALLAAALEEPVLPPSRLAPEVPAALDEAVLRCLEKDPAARYEGLVELDQALAGALSSARSSIHPLLLAAIAAAALLVAGLLVVLLVILGAGAPPGVATSPTPTPTASPAPTASLASSPSASPRLSPSPAETPPTLPSAGAKIDLDHVMRSCQSGARSIPETLVDTGPLLARYPRWARLRYLRAQLLLDCGRYGEVWAEIDTGDQAPDARERHDERDHLIRVILDTGAALGGQGRYEDVVLLLRPLATTGVQAGIPYANACRATLRHEEALRVLKSLRDQGRREWQITYHMAGALLSLWRPQEAFALYEEVAADDRTPPAMRAISLLRCAEGSARTDPDRAEVFLLRAMEICPTLPEIPSQRAVILLERGRLAEAEALAREGLEGEHWRRCSHVLVAALVLQGRRAEAEALVKRSLARSDDPAMRQALEGALARTPR